MNKLNAHHTIWGSSNIKPQGEDLLAYCVSADLNFCNVSNKPIFRTKTKTRDTLARLTRSRLNLSELVCVGPSSWLHVSNMLSFSDHMYIMLLP